MPDDGVSTALWILLGINTLLLFLLWLGQLGQSARLRRICQDLEVGTHGTTASAHGEKPEGDPGPSLFQRWLAEDSSRLGMPKKEQFAAYRKWRAEQGLTWKTSPDD